MTGTEAAVAGGRLLGGLAAPAASRLRKKVVFRWVVSRRVKQKVDFKVPGRAYRAWLKGLGVYEMTTPVEEIIDRLAVDLDLRLAAAHRPWSLFPDHLSRSLTLVEATYPAIAAALDDADRAELGEAWAQSRNGHVRDLLLVAAGPGALSSADLALALQSRSQARRAVRLQAFSLSETDLGHYFSRITSPEVPVGGVRVIEGDFGSGKSEVAETWHRAAIRHLAANGKAPIPVWMRAHELSGTTLESAMDLHAGSAWRSGRGARLVVDGLDETDILTASRVLDSARVLTRVHPGLAVLVTARPGVLTLNPDESARAPMLTEDESVELVAYLGADRHAAASWTDGMRATVRRPFFALAAGEMLKRDEAPRSEADLVRSLVEHALQRANEREPLTSAATRIALTKAAISLTNTSKDGLSFAERQIVRSSRLVDDGPDGGIWFALPIFQHWFAAQALLDGQVAPSIAVSDRRHFGRWRWAAAIAAISAPNDLVLDELVDTWIRGNPGAAAWIIREAFGGARRWRTEDQPLDPATSGSRLLRALRTWADGLGPLAIGVLPTQLVEGPVGLGVRVSGGRLDVGFATAQPTKDYVTDLPPSVHPLAPSQDAEWRTWISGGPPEGDGWPWIYVLREIAGSMIGRLNWDPYLGAPDGVWVQERRYDLARRLAGKGSLFDATLPTGEARSQAQFLLERVGWDLDATVQFGMSTSFSALEVDELAEWIDSSAPSHIERGLPSSDVRNPPTAWVWDAYTPRRLMEFEVEVHGRACEAYDEAMSNSLSDLGWSMPSSAIAPFGVVLEAFFKDGSGFEDSPTLTVVRVPMPLMQQVARSTSSSIWSANGRAVITEATEPYGSAQRAAANTMETIRSWLAESSLEYFGGLSWSMTGADDMSNVRPACSVAARWLWDDLRSIGLGEGTVPQLR